MAISIQDGASGTAESDKATAYIVLEKSPIIAEDISAALMKSGPGAIICVSHVDELARALESTPSLTAAVLELRLSTLVETGLDKRLDALGAKVVLTLGEDEESAVRARGYHLLVRPFSEQMIHELIAAQVV